MYKPPDLCGYQTDCVTIIKQADKAHSRLLFVDPVVVGKTAVVASVTQRAGVEAGTYHADAVAELARRAGVESAGVVEVPTDWSRGWDLADDLPPGVTPDRLPMMLDDAPDDVVVIPPPGFRMSAEGLFPDLPPIERSPNLILFFAATQFRVVGETRNVTGKGARHEPG